MKKVFSIFLSVIFLASAMGMTINAHFCGTKLQSVSLVEQGCCCKKDSNMPKGCCKNEVKYVKITDDYSPSSQLHLEKIDFSSVFLNPVFVSELSSVSYFQLPNNHSPPPKFADIVIASHSLLI